MRLVVVFPLILLFYTTSFGVVIHVPEDYPTIQEAVDNCTAGDEIQVAPGIYGPVYAEDLFNIKFIGAGIIPPNVTVIDVDDSCRGVAIHTSEKIIFDGFEIRDCWQECLHFYDSRNITISNNYLHDCNDNLGNGLAITRCNDVYIHRNVIVENFEIGLYIDALWDPDSTSKNIRVINNTIGFTGNGYVGADGLTQSWSDTGFVYINNINVFNSDYGLHYKFFYQTSLSEIGYNCHYGNLFGPWGGCSGDSTNIYVDPQFDGGMGILAYFLSSTSPCIDAGDPTILDPDSTRSDIGALPYMEGNIDELLIDLIPYHEPIIVPPEGGEFRYGVEIRNESLGQVYFDVWLTLRLPNGYVTDPFIVRQNQFLPGNGYLLRNPIMNVSPMAMPGIYSMLGYVGYYPGYVADADSFDFEKEEWTDEIAQGNPTWSISGWGNTEYFDMPVSLPEPESHKVALNASPNPFNPETTISFDLREAGIMSLKIYDITGREVATLYVGYALPGLKEFEWNAKSLPSGIYFAQLETQQEQRIKRLLLIK